jgi:uncharacterized protein (TIGR00290 family)
MLALHRARESGVEIAGLLCMLEETGARTRSHGVPLALVEAQARSLGLPIVTPPASWQDYESAFTTALRALREQGVTDIVFGDIDLDSHRAWEERVCEVAGLRARLPLWQVARDEAVRDVFSLGYRARVVCVNAKWLGDTFAGRLFDEAFVRDLPAGVDACGENGEFHTFVFDGPLFRWPVEHRVGGVVRYEAKHERGEATYFFARLET